MQPTRYVEFNLCVRFVSDSLYQSLGKFRQDEECYLNSGKIKALVRLLEQYGKEERKVLVFSQVSNFNDGLVSR